jgi:hypothetical protein
MWFVVVFSMLVNTFYLSILSGVFTEPNYEAKITTFEDFAKSDVVLEWVVVEPLRFDHFEDGGKEGEIYKTNGFGRDFVLFGQT